MEETEKRKYPVFLPFHMNKIPVNANEWRIKPEAIMRIMVPFEKSASGIYFSITSAIRPELNKANKKRSVIIPKKMKENHESRESKNGLAGCSFSTFSEGFMVSSVFFSIMITTCF
jgi:hypothetical protein